MEENMINHIPMRRAERQVTDISLIEGMLKMFNVLHLGVNDTDGYPYVVPVNFGFERTETSFIFYVHHALEGHLIDLLKRDPHVCITLDVFSDFPGERIQGHVHDYRSVIAKGEMRLLDPKNPEDFDLYMHAHMCLQTCNNREFDYEKRAQKLPPMYMMMAEIPFEDLTAKAEVPINSLEDLPLWHR